MKPVPERSGALSVAEGPRDGCPIRIYGVLKRGNENGEKTDCRFGSVIIIRFIFITLSYIIVMYAITY